MHSFSEAPVGQCFSPLPASIPPSVLTPGVHPLPYTHFTSSHYSNLSSVLASSRRPSLTDSRAPLLFLAEPPAHVHQASGTIHGVVFSSG